ncbi:hypothetical protein P1J78_18145 [Psychromarinibacter sp. C21-152]|uniref:Uncharacterized protein n=1 Tax=Psychromarinibacter sediminicola TaxID=3033385 RepID=A0AAE3TB48_9RHOB|nr:hypothetical protein [Psychromarinibacter sediminicola]MDF0602664.1 hypothetical protein [Psychromarinibacter sediminicola]
MLPHEIDHIRQDLPDEMAFPYYADRESPWLLARRMRAPEKVAVLRQGPLARYLDRPLVKPVVAECGGVLDPGDVWAAGQADVAARRDLSRPALAGAIAAFDVPWFDFGLSFAAWGTGHQPQSAQMSRSGGNLVIQLGFPSDHAWLMAQYGQGKRRKTFEYVEHPIRRSGRPTLAWARVDVDCAAGVALIEEVQNDWLRFAAETALYLRRTAQRGAEVRRICGYSDALRQRYGRIWPRAMLLAVLAVLVEELGIAEIWMHQPEAGAVYKHIRGRTPPVSLYSALPKSFGFEPVAEAPPFLARYKRKTIGKLRRRGLPVFWRLAL